MEEAAVWFGWGTFTDRSKGWTRLPADADKQTAAMNNGKILGEVMCHKESANDKVTLLCDKTDKDFSTEVCSVAQRNYIQADECAGQKFDDVIKCFHACAWDDGQPMRKQFA